MNYKHLRYFWTVARSGSIAAASGVLHLTPQTLSGQIKQLEARVGQPLLRKAGRGVEPTEAGRLMERYADEIFSLATEMEHALQGRQQPPRQALFRVGVTDAVPKSIACHVLEPCVTARPFGPLVCLQGKLPALLADLAVHKLDMVVSDVPLPSSLGIKAYTHLLGKTGVSFFAALPLLRRQGWTLRRARSGFPGVLADLPLLLPAAGTALRPRLDAWLRDAKISPRIAGEFDDSALTKAFGRRSLGVFPGPTVLAPEIARQYAVACIGSTEALLEEFYAISIERRITHPAVAAVTNAARHQLFA